MRNLIGLIVVAVGAICAAVAHASTISTPLTTGVMNAFGTPNTQTYGQTITTPADHFLQSFSFYMDLPAALAFQGEVYAWDGSEAAGSALYENAPVSTAGAGMQQITFNVGGANLIAGRQYVLFASSSKLANGGNLQGPWGISSTNYTGGNFVFINSGTTPSLWTSTPWFQISLPNNGDLAFTAEFSPTANVVPLPRSEWSGLILLGGVGLARGLGRRAQSSLQVTERD
ncbi:MAG TPA: hypothetical protein VIM11_20860 [Tepidisphaeraceae bacterium]